MCRAFEIWAGCHKHRANARVVKVMETAALYAAAQPRRVDIGLIVFARIPVNPRNNDLNTAGMNVWATACGYLVWHWKHPSPN